MEDLKTLAEELKKLSPAPKIALEIFEALRHLLPMVAIELFVTNPKGEFALVRKGEGWAMPGGYLGLEEGFEEACQRLAKKYLEAELDKIEPKKVFNLPESIHGKGQGHAVALIFQCQTKTSSDQITYFRQIPEGVWPHHQMMLEEIIDKSKR